MNVFVSYHYDSDRNMKELLNAWSGNRNVDFEFTDTSIDVSVNSDAAGPIRRAITRRMGNSDVVLVIIGKYTHQSDWVEWEIEKAYELKKPIVAVKRDAFGNTTPDALYGKGVKWVNSFERDAIIEAVRDAWLYS